MKRVWAKIRVGKGTNTQAQDRKRIETQGKTRKRGPRTYRLGERETADCPNVERGEVSVLVCQNDPIH